MTDGLPPGALDGVRILEFSEMIAAPFAGMHLGDLGADIIKVEPTEGESWRLANQFAPQESRAFLALNRNKRDLTLNLKTEAGREVIYKLIPTIDVVIVNYRPDTPANLGIDYDTLRALNGRLIYVENTAMGREGPYSHRPGYDLVAQAMTGLLLSGGRVDDDGVPLPLTPAIADYGTGLTIAFAVCAALFTRERTGKGQKVEATLLATALALQGGGFMRTATNTGRSVEADAGDTRRAARARNAYYRVYKTNDSMIALACLTPVLRRKAADAMGIDDPRHTREIPRDSEEAGQVAEQVTTEVVKRMEERTTAEWLEAFDAAGVPAGPVNSIRDMADDPQVIANRLAVSFDHPVVESVTMVGPVFKMSETPSRAQSAPPTLGQHNDEILTELGYSEVAIQELREQGVVR
jgi:formyl-CoA transferase